MEYASVRKRFDLGSEGIIIAPETRHALAPVTREADRAREEDKAKTILLRASLQNGVEAKSYRVRQI
jgi:predicted alternative tryptophan synthase beta-subunit